ncbi:ribosomal protein S19 family protein, partial [Escherichia coli]
MNSFCYQTVNIKTHQSIAISIDTTNSNSYYYHFATTQRYGNRLIHRCDDRLDPQLDEMVGHKLGEFAPTRTYRGHAA